MTPERLRFLRERGLTLATIGRLHFSPPVSRETVRLLCLRYDITFGMIKGERSTRRPADPPPPPRLPRIDPRRAARITQFKRAWWAEVEKQRA